MSGPPLPTAAVPCSVRRLAGRSGRAPEAVVEDRVVLDVGGDHRPLAGRRQRVVALAVVEGERSLRRDVLVEADPDVAVRVGPEVDVAAPAGRRVVVAGMWKSADRLRLRVVDRSAVTGGGAGGRAAVDESRAGDRRSEERRVGKE